MRKFFLLLLFYLIGVFGVETDEEKTVSVMEGDSVILNSGVAQIQRDDYMEWRFKSTLIARANIPQYDNEERFRDRLKLDHQTGSLTITNTRTTDSGLYKLNTIDGNKEISKRFSVTVYAPLSLPVITSDISKCSSSSRCVLLCSVMDVTRVNLSWFKGNSLLSSISVSDLSISLSLPLEVEYQDNNTYSCVLNNPLSNQTRHVCITDLCRLCSGPSSDEVHYCGGTEAVIRLVVTALMGLAAVAAFIVLVYDIRSRRVEQERHQTLNDGSDTVKQE